MAARMRSSQPVRAAGRPVSQLGRPRQGQVGKIRTHRATIRDKQWRE